MCRSILCQFLPEVIMHIENHCCTCVLPKRPFFNIREYATIFCMGPQGVHLTPAAQHTCREVYRAKQVLVSAHVDRRADVQCACAIKLTLDRVTAAA
ncbi:MAG: hypothetical protein ACYTEX_03795 [Planctomycetota bacterium]